MIEKSHPKNPSIWSLTASGEDDEGRYETMERIREVAKQARMIIGEVYGQGVMDTFSADLTSLAAGVEGESGWMRKNAQSNYSRYQ